METLSKLTYAMDRVKESLDSIERLCRGGTISIGSDDDIVQLLAFRKQLADLEDHATVSDDFEQAAVWICERHQLPRRLEHAVSTFLAGVERILGQAARSKQFGHLFVVPILHESGTWAHINDPETDQAGVSFDEFFLPCVPLTLYLAAAYADSLYAPPRRPYDWYYRPWAERITVAFQEHLASERKRREHTEAVKREEDARARWIKEENAKTPEQRMIEKLESEIVALKAAQQPAPTT